MLLDKSNLNEEVLQNLIRDRVLENAELEYKDYIFPSGKLSDIKDKERDKLIKEIAAFANTNGGIIIIGMQEEDRLPYHLSGVGMQLTAFDEWLSSLRQAVLARIRPHLHGVEYEKVELHDGTIAVVIFVPKSYARPHSFWDGNKDEFNMRYANGLAAMSIDDLRREFLYSNSFRSQIREFRRDRISMILSNEIIGDLGDNAKFVFYIIPEWSFDFGNFVNLKTLENDPNFKPFSGGGYNFGYNIDGYYIYGSNHKTDKINTHTQVFYNGIIEIIEIRLLSAYGEYVMCEWPDFQGAIIRTIDRYESVLSRLNVPKPWYLSASMLNVKGYSTSNGWGRSIKLDRNIINSLDSVWNDGETIDVVLKPILDSLANAFGYKESGCSKELVIRYSEKINIST